jgi:uncharacterized delta-60 repeat protein
VVRASLGRKWPRSRVALGAAALLAVLAGAVVWALPHASSSAPLEVGVAGGFGHGGTLAVPASAGFDNWAYGFRATPAPDGGIVVAGYREVLSLGPDGLPRAGFGRGGIKRIGPDGGRRLEIEDVAVDRRGRIVLFGGATRPRDEDVREGRFPDQAAIVRLLPDGGFDPSFGGGGIVTSAFGASARTYDGPYVSADLGAVDARGRPLFTLPTAHPGTPCEVEESSFRQFDESRVVRLDLHGTPDPSFDGNGISTPFATGASSMGFGLRPDGDTQLVATGDAGCRRPLLIQRRLPDGRPDTGFGPEGVRSYPTLRARATAPDAGGGLLLLRSGPFVLGGKTRSAYVERLTAAGTLDRSFGHEGVATVTVPGFDSHFCCIAADARGRIYVVGTRIWSEGHERFRTGSRLVARRLTPDGRPDRGFGADGIASAHFPGLLVIAKTAVLSGPRLVVIGTGHPAATGSNPADLVFAAFPTGH